MFYQLLKAHCDICPNKIAIKNDNFEVTYKELFSFILNMAYNLHTKNICEGSVIVLGAMDEYDFVIYTLVLLSMGCWIVPDPDNQAEVVFQKNNCKIDVKINKENKNQGSLPQINKEQFIEIDTYLNKCESGGLYHMTSGTTGESKICVRDISSLMFEAENFIYHYNLNSKDIIASFCGLLHSFAFGGCLMTFLKLGCTICLIKNMTYQDAIKFIEKQRVTMVLAVPFIVRMLNILRLQQSTKLSNVKVFLVGAGKMERSQYFAFYKKYGIYLLSNYGSTETGAILSRTNYKAYSSVGVPMKNVEVKIIDKQGRDSNEGLLFVKSKSMMIGYYNDKVCFDQDGYYNTGDIVRVRQGRYYIVGRQKLFINIAGKKINPEEIETIICELSDVNECVVACDKSATVENNTTAYVIMVLGKNFDAEKIRNYCKQKLKPHQVPMYYQNVVQIHKDAQGKIKRSFYFYK